jgi:hypothetical protein
MLKRETSTSTATRGLRISTPTIYCLDGESLERKQGRMSVDRALQGIRDARKRLTDIASIKDDAEKARIIDEVKVLNVTVTKDLEAIAANPDQIDKKQYKLLRREMFGLQLAFNAASLAYLASYFSPT